MSIVNKRQSIRKFNSNKVEKETLIKLVESGMLAPSSKNRKPWEFIIIDDKKIINELSLAHKNWSILKNVESIIIVCGNLEKDEREKHTLMTCSAATENILVRSVELGLGSVWLGLYGDKIRMDFVKNRFNLTSVIIPVSLIAVGYYDDAKERVIDFDYEKIHFNKF